MVGLNLAYLRSTIGSSLDAVIPVAQRILDPLQRPTRRLILQGVGVVAASGAGALLPIEEPQIRGTHKRIAIWWRGEERFVLDSSRFGALAGHAPSLSWKRGDGHIAIALRRARFPGTSLSGDLDLSLQRGGDGDWTAHLRFTDLPWQARGALNEWLLDLTPLRGRTSGAVDLALGDWQSTLSVAGNQILEVGRNLAIAVTGDRAVVFQCDGQNLAAREMRFDPLSRLLRLSDALETAGSTIQLTAAGDGWTLPAGMPLPANSALHVYPGTLTSAELDLVEGPGMGRAFAAVLRSTPRMEAGSFTPSTHFSVGGGGRFAIHMLQYALAGSGATRQSALLASFSPEAVHTALAGATFALAGGGREPELELVSIGTNLTSASCKPIVTSLSLPLGDDIIQTSSIPFASRISLGFEEQPCPTPSSWGHLNLNSATRNPVVVLGTFSFSVLRPIDMLSLRFELSGVELRSRNGCVAFYRKKGIANALLKVFFAPQHVATEDLLNLQDVSKDVPSPNSTVGAYKPTVPPISGPVHSILANPSRLVFNIPGQYEERGIDCTLEGLLRWSELQLAVAPNAIPELGELPPLLPAHWDNSQAVPPASVRPTWSVGDDQTAIEFPYGIFLSPHKWSTWHHSVAPVDQRNSGVSDATRRTELWHTRHAPFQAVGVDANGVLRASEEIRNPNDPRYHAALRTVRAIASRQGARNGSPGCLVPSPHGNWISTPLLPDLGAARDIARLSSDFGAKTQVTGQDYKPVAISYARLMLSAFGTSGYLHGAWARYRPAGENGEPDVQVDEWIQDSNWGRDDFVLVSLAGFGVCTGHYISLVVTHDLNFVPSENGSGWVAALRRRFYCEVREPTKSYTYPAPGVALPGRRIYRKIEISPKRTPFLKTPVDCATKQTWCGDTDFTPGSFWMIPEGNAENDPFKFQITATDLDGNTSKFELPLLWVNATLAFRHSDDDSCQVGDGGLCSLSEVLERFYNSDEYKPWRTADLRGQKVALAPKSEKPRDGSKDRAFEVAQFIFSADIQCLQPIPWPSLGDWDLRFYPAIFEGVVRLGPVSEFGGKDHSGQRIRYNNIYATYGFTGEQNKGGVFLDLLGSNKFNFDAAKSGGLATPHLPLSVYSRMIGPAGGPAPQDGDPAYLLLPTQRLGARDLPPAPPSGVNAVVSAKFDPSEFFKGALPRLLGDLDISELCEVIEDVEQALDRIPQLVDEVAQAAAPYLTKIEEARKKYDEIRNTLQRIQDIYEHLPQLAQDAENAILSVVRDQIERLVDAEVDRIQAQYVGPGLALIDQAVDAALQNLSVTLADAAADIEPYNKLLNRAARDVATFRDLFNPTDLMQNVATTFNAVTNGIDQVKAAKVPLGAFLALIDDVKVAFSDLGNAFDDPPSAPAALARLRSGFEKLKTALNEDPVRSEMTLIKNLVSSLQQPFQNLGRLVDAHFCALNNIVLDIAMSWGVSVSGPHIARATSDPVQDYKKSLQELYDNTLLRRVNEYQRAYASFRSDFERDIAAANAALATLDDSIASQVQTINNKLGAIAGGPKTIDDIRIAILGILDEIITEADSLIGQIPQSVTLKYSWKPKLQDKGAFIASTEDGSASLVLTTTITKQLIDYGAAPTYEIRGEMKNFAIKIMPSNTFLILSVKSVTFASQNGSKPDVKLNIKGVTFGSQLDFIAKLAALLHPQAGPYLDIDASGATAGFMLPIPNITTGAFSLIDLSINPEVHLPFDGTPMVSRLSISTRSRHFLMSYGIYGGGGFFALIARPSKAVSIEGALEGLVVTAISFPLADGIAAIAIGIYFSVSDDDAKLTGYFRAFGTFEIIGMISLVVDFYLGLTYESGGKASGVCTVHIEIGYAFVTIGVDVTAHRTLSGGDGGGARDARVTRDTRYASLLAASSPATHVPRVDRPRVEVDFPHISEIEDDWRRYRKQFFQWKWPETVS